MTTSVDSSVPNKLTVKSDKLYNQGSVVIGADTANFPIPAAIPKFSGVSPTLVSDDKALPVTTQVYSY